MRRYIELVRPLATEAQPARDTETGQGPLLVAAPSYTANASNRPSLPPSDDAAVREGLVAGIREWRRRSTPRTPNTPPEAHTREHARRRGADVAVPFFQAELLRRESDFAKAAPAQGTPPPTRPPAHPPTRIYRPGSGHLPAASPSTLRRKGTLAFSGARCAAGGDSTSSYIKPFWDTMYLGGRHGRRSGSHWGTCRHEIPIHFPYSLGRYPVAVNQNPALILWHDPRQPTQACARL